MTIPEAMKLLDAAPRGDGPSRLNPAFTVSQAIDIIKRGLGPRFVDSDGHLIPVFEKRVLQVTTNRVRVRYEQPATETECAE